MKHLTPHGPKTSDSQTHKLYKESEIDVLARTMWGEARGQGSVGLQAVANVVLNRVKIATARGGYWWGNNIIQVCRKPYQFSCWNVGDPNREKLLRVTSDNLNFATCLRIARRAVFTRLEDVTGGADHYHATYVAPYWAKGERPVGVIGDHVFYRLVD